LTYSVNRKRKKTMMKVLLHIVGKSRKLGIFWDLVFSGTTFGSIQNRKLCTWRQVDSFQIDWCRNKTVTFSDTQRVLIDISISIY